MSTKNIGSSCDSIGMKFSEDDGTQEGIYMDDGDANMKRSIRPSDIWGNTGTIGYSQGHFGYSFDGINDPMIHKSGIFSTGAVSDESSMRRRESTIITKSGQSWDQLAIDGYKNSSNSSMIDDASIVNILLHKFKLNHINELSSFFSPVKCPSCDRVLFSFMAEHDPQKDPNSCCHKNPKLEEPLKIVVPKKEDRPPNRPKQPLNPTPQASTGSIRKRASRPPPVLDLDKHCGVSTTSNDPPCMRSLSCKSHSILAKRAITGRSKPFDELLAKQKLERQAEKASSVSQATNAASEPSIKREIGPSPFTEPAHPKEVDPDPLLTLLRSSYTQFPTVMSPYILPFGRSNLRHLMACGITHCMMNTRRATNFASLTHPVGATQAGSAEGHTIPRPQKMKRKLHKPETPVPLQEATTFSMPDITSS